jgi:hypothetical protein
MAVKVVGSADPHIGFPTDAISIPGVEVKTAYTVNDGYQAKEDIIGEAGDVVAQVFSDERQVISFSGILSDGATPVKNGDTATVSGKYATLSGISIAYTNKTAVISGTIEVWGTNTP